MGDTELLEIETWYLLFDRLCSRTGYLDDAALAAAYCAHVGREGQVQYDAVLRSFNNWRSGRHLPRAGNLRVLEELLRKSQSARRIQVRQNRRRSCLPPPSLTGLVHYHQYLRNPEYRAGQQLRYWSVQRCYFAAAWRWVAV
jgi:hypothetical protein